MKRITFECGICGWYGLPKAHSGAVDCIAQYRAYVEELKSLLPRGEQVLCAPISRDGTARLWIEGQPDEDSLTRLITYLEFTRTAWTPEAERPKTLGDSDLSRPTTEAVGGVAVCPSNDDGLAEKAN